MSELRPLRRFLKVCGEYSPQVFMGIVFSIFSIIPDIIAPIIFGDLTNDIVSLDQYTRQFAWWFAIAILVNMVINSVLKFIVTRYEFSLSYKIAGAYVEDMSTHILSLSPDWFTKQKQGSIMSNVYHVMAASQGLTGTLIFDHIGQLSVLVGSLGFAAYRYGWIALPICAVIGLSAFLSYKLDKKYSVGPTRVRSQLYKRLYGFISDPIMCHSVVRDYHAGYIEKRKIAGACKEWEHGCIKQGYIRATGISLISISNAILFGSVILMSVAGLMSGYLNAGDVVYINSLCLTLKGYVTTISNSARTTRESLADLAECEEVFETRKHYVKPNINDDPERQDLIRFRNVAFHYPSSKSLTLANINFTILRGESVGIVGESGSGKTTLLRLLQCEYAPTRGTISMGSGFFARPIQGFVFSHVQQDTMLFHRSVLENICYPRDLSSGKYNFEKVVEAAQKAGAHDFIMGLEKGYDTVVGDRGVLLSGGQRQRIAIARAFFNNTSILILDEATANLDSVSEEIVQNSLTMRPKMQTLIVIAHRLKTIRDMDKIIVLQDGCIVGVGKHDELLVTTPYYRTLCEKQNAL